MAAVALVVGLILGSVGTLGIAAVAGSDDSTNESSASSDDSDSTSDYEDVAEDDEEPEGASYEPTTDDFAIEVSVKEQQCFGEAGCSTTFGIEPTYTGLETPTGKFEITYELTGVEDGPVIETFTVEDSQFSFSPEISATVPSASTPVKAKITRVTAGY
jgi:hypothetical protein